MYDGSTFSTLDVPGAVATIPQSIDGGLIAGSYWDANNAAHAFLYNGSSFTPIDGPGSSYTRATSISGDTVAGWYFDSGFNGHGFLFTASAVPEPGSLALFGIGAVGLIGWAWRRGRRTVSLP